MDGVVIIGEGEKDEAPMLYNGEDVGAGVPPEVDIAVDPIDGTTAARGGASWLARRARRSPRGERCSIPGRASTWRSSSSVHDAVDAMDLDRADQAENLAIAVAKATGSSELRDLTVIMLDRDRHEEAEARDPRELVPACSSSQHGDVAAGVLRAARRVGRTSICSYGIGGTPGGRDHSHVRVKCIER
jgi:fructose-1,6-bisphosphatase II